MLTEKDKGLPLYAYSAYIGEEQDKICKKKEVISKVHVKGYRNKPLTQTQKARNKEKSSMRVRIEQVFYSYNIFRSTQLKIVVAMG